MLYLKEVFLGRREGKIVLFVSAVYLVIGTLANALPTQIPLSEFYRWMCFFMPIVMLIFYLKIGGFKKHFESGAFNTIMLTVVSLTPVLMKLSVFVKR